MTPQIKDEIRERKKAERKYYTRTSSTDNLINFKRLKASVRRMMKKARKEAWEEFVSSINEKTSFDINGKRLTVHNIKY
jgi:glucan phosphorylase